MKKYTLPANLRELKGRKVKRLRQSGRLPGNLYGRKIKSVAVDVDLKDFDQVFAEAGETNVVELHIDKTKHPVLIHQVQLDPVRDVPLHVDFLQVDLKEKVKASVPVAFVGESPAVEQKLGVMLEMLTEVEVEALPTDLPNQIEVDVSGLTQVGNTITVKELSVPKQVTVLTPVAVEVVKIGELVKVEEPEPEAAVEAEPPAEPEAEAKAEDKDAKADITDDKKLQSDTTKKPASDQDKKSET